MLFSIIADIIEMSSSHKLLTLSIPTTTVVVVDHLIPTTTTVVVDHDLSNLSAVNRPRARNPRDTCAVTWMCYHSSCTAAIEKVFYSLRAVLTKLVTIVAESLSSILPKWRPPTIRSVMGASLVRNSMILATFRPESDSYLSTRLINTADTGDSSLPATTGYHKIQLQEALFTFRFLGNMIISSTELFSDIHKLHKAIKQIQINGQ